VQSSFTQFLLRNEYVSLAELEEASQATVLYGGRLGTALIELGILTPEQLDAALARHHGLPEIPREWLTRPDAGARAALHIDLIKRHRAFPLNFEKRSLHVGLVDPRNEPVLDNLAFASGCLIVPYALAEFRFVDLMRRVFRIAPSARFRTLLDEGNRARVMRGREEQRKQAAANRAESDQRLGIARLAPDTELSDRDAFLAAQTTAARPLESAVGAAAPAAAAPPAPNPAPQEREAARAILEIDPDTPLLDRRTPLPTLEVLERAIAESEDRARVIDSSIALAGRFAEVAALFVIRDGMAAGLAAQRGGNALDVDATLIPLAADSVLARCYSTREPQRALPVSALDKLLARALRSDDDSELAVFAIAIRERVVNLLVAQPTRGVMSATAAAALAAVAPQIGNAYERLIRVQKQNAQVAATTAAAPAQPNATAPGVLKAALGALPLQKRLVKVPTNS
jgi:Type II secretion system (T2SS), protein E, N-terminal domain